MSDDLMLAVALLWLLICTAVPSAIYWAISHEGGRIDRVLMHLFGRWI